LNLAYSLAAKLQVGSVAINDAMASYSDLPSGGVKMSGHGKECYKDGIWEIGVRKSIC
jgi:acyl-CoA reductase-like NAD-dependent aldehyde dehydrogenase